MLKQILKMDKTIRKWFGALMLFAMAVFIIEIQVCKDSPRYLVDQPNFSINYPGAPIAPPYNLETLPLLDFQTLIDLKDFKFKINSHVCNNSNPMLIVLISSAPKNFELRNTVRNTWAKKVESVRVLFMLGRSDEYESRILKESVENKDIIQGNFVDDYRNMTYKHTMGLKWATYFCRQAKYVLKTDDDVFVNMPMLEDFLVKEFSPWGAANLIMCDIFFKNKVFRSFRSKWRVGVDDFKDDYYPPYCAGYAILYSPDVVFKLYQKVQQHKYFWIDDVHLTGIIREKLDIGLTQSMPLTLSREQIFLLMSPFKFLASLGKFLYGAPDISHWMIESFWNKYSFRF